MEEQASKGQSGVCVGCRRELPLRELDMVERGYLCAACAAAQRPVAEGTQPAQPVQMGRPLPMNWAAVVVTGVGALLVLLSMFLPQASSTSVAEIKDNLMIQNHPVSLLCVLAAITGSVRFIMVGTKASASTVWWAGLWFLGWAIYDGATVQLKNLATGELIDTSASAGMWALGVGCSIVALGGLMMRWPFFSFGLVSGPAMLKSEHATMTADTKACPQCAETVKAAAKVCRFCGHSFG